MNWTPPSGRVLVLAPHPDDETLGCGGALLHHRGRKDPVRVIFLSDGKAGDPENRSGARDLASLRRREARAAARVRGVSEFEVWDYPDGKLSGVRGLAARLAALLKKTKPRLLYRPASDDPHPDHRAVGRAVERALRRIKPRLLDCRYEVWSAARPTAVLDISADFSRKTKALQLYRSQRAYLDLPAMARRLNASRGLILKNALYGEGYRIRQRD